MHRPPERGDLVWGRNLFHVFCGTGDFFRRDAEDSGVVLQSLLRIDRADGYRALFQTFTHLWSNRYHSYVGGTVLRRALSTEALDDPAGGLVDAQSARGLCTAAKNER